MTMTPNSIRIAGLQISLVDNDIAANLGAIETHLRALAGLADLVVLPEAFTTGFSPEATAYADAWPSGLVLRWMRDLSTELGLGICGSYIVRESSGACYNRFVLVDGYQECYQDKRHLFSLGGEPAMVIPASDRRVLTFRGWRVMPLVCYDLRFPVWSRVVDNDYDIIIAVASWPRGRRRVWQTLLEARAMENLAYCVGVNRIGKDALGLSYAGDSVIHSPRGEVLAATPEDEEAVIVANLDYAPLAELRRKFPVWQDADTFIIHS